MHLFHQQTDKAVSHLSSAATVLLYRFLSPFHLTNPQALISLEAFVTPQAVLATSVGSHPSPGLFLHHNLCSPYCQVCIHPLPHQPGVAVPAQVFPVSPLPSPELGAQQAPECLLNG